MAVRGKFTEGKDKIFDKIRENLKSSATGGIITGVLGIIGYGIFMSRLGWRFICFSFLFAAACYVSGFFLGILFGIPKRQNNDSQAEYVLNNNLADISDWLTKIIIGLGLVELKNIPGYLTSAGNYVMYSIDKNESSLKLFAICCIVYFFVFGLYYGYCYMRLYLSSQIKDADDNLLKKLEEKKVELEKEIIEKNIIPSETSSIDKETKKKFSEFNEQLKSAKTEDEYTAEDWYLKGIDAYGKNEYEKTISCMKNALAKNSKSSNAEANAFLYIGLSYTNMGLPEKSIEQYDKIISLYNNYDNLYLIYYNKGIALNRLKRYEEALIAQNKSIELKADYEYSWTSKGFILQNLNLQNEALIALNKAIEINPNYDLPWFNKSYTLINLNLNDAALIAVNRAIELKPNFDESWYNKAIILCNLEKYEDALIAINKTIELKPDHGNAWITKGHILINLNKYEEALNASYKGVELKSDSAIVWTNISVALINLKKFDEALNAANKSLSFDIDYSNAYYAKGRSFAGLGNKESMLEALKKAIQLDSNWKESIKTSESFKPFLEDEDLKKIIE
ncbi:MAG TPA: tetratricopeptide repeat protein [Bacteroidia bacterium]|jgi:tetratricopeptide (TPR) repeat protein|nr:tetratricopeptide repeat protein [Bacteroidia bacterium]